VIVAVIAMRMVQAAIHKVVHVIAMRHRLMTAAGTVAVTVAVNLMRAVNGILLAHLDLMLFFVASIGMDQASVL